MKEAFLIFKRLTKNRKGSKIWCGLCRLIIFWCFDLYQKNSHYSSLLLVICVARTANNPNVFQAPTIRHDYSGHRTSRCSLTIHNYTVVGEREAMGEGTTTLVFIFIPTSSSTSQLSPTSQSLFLSTFNRPPCSQLADLTDAEQQQQERLSLRCAILSKVESQNIKIASNKVWGPAWYPALLIHIWFHCTTMQCVTVAFNMLLLILLEKTKIEYWPILGAPPTQSWCPECPKMTSI